VRVGGGKRQETIPMRLDLRVVAMAFVALVGCSSVQQDVSQLQQQQDALSVAIKKIKVVSRVNVKGNPPYTELGPTQGYCFNLANSTGGQVVHGDGLKAAAYRKYGGQVDAIVKTTIWFVPDDSSDAFEPYTENGYFECAGTAVHFTLEPVPAASSAQPPAS
jgi:hypothetical protein